MITTHDLEAVAPHLGDAALVAIAYADFGNGHGLIYGLAQVPDGQFMPFSMQRPYGTPGGRKYRHKDFRFWPDLGSDDMGVGQMVALIDHLMNEEPRLVPEPEFPLGRIVTAKPKQKRRGASLGGAATMAIKGPRIVSAKAPRKAR